MIPFFRDNLGGNPEWDNRMAETLNNFDLASPEVKQQFGECHIDGGFMQHCLVYYRIIMPTSLMNQLLMFMGLFFV